MKKKWRFIAITTIISVLCIWFLEWFSYNIVAQLGDDVRAVIYRTTWQSISFFYKNPTNEKLESIKNFSWDVVSLLAMNFIILFFYGLNFVRENVVFYFYSKSALVDRPIKYPTNWKTSFLRMLELAFGLIISSLLLNLIAFAFSLVSANLVSNNFFLVFANQVLLILLHLSRIIWLLAFYLIIDKRLMLLHAWYRSIGLCFTFPVITLAMYLFLLGGDEIKEFHWIAALVVTVVQAYFRSATYKLMRKAIVGTDTTAFVSHFPKFNSVTKVVTISFVIALCIVIGHSILIHNTFTGNEIALIAFVPMLSVYSILEIMNWKGQAITRQYIDESEVI